MTPPGDVAVIGAGIIGLSTAYHFARQGLSVTVYEAGRPGFGQSAGQSRIFRHAHDDPRLIRLAVRARDRWNDWADEFGATLVSDDGAIALGTAVPRRYELLRANGVDAQRLDTDDLRRLLPMLADYEGDAMIDPGGGSIHTRAAIDILAQQFRERIVSEQVITLQDTGDGVAVRTPTTVGHHGAAVICAGRGTAALARGIGLALPIKLGAHVRVSFAVATPVDQLPTLQDGSGFFGASGVYAAAYPDLRGYGLGMAGSIDAHDDGAIDDAAGLAALADDAVRYVERALPGLDPTPTDIVHCWVTTLPWGDDGVALWQRGSVTAVAGHNLFKHAPVIGEAAAEAVTSGQVPGEFAAEERLGRAAG